MSFAQNLKDLFFTSNTRSNKENNPVHANPPPPMKKRFLAPLAQRIIGKYNTTNNNSQQNMDPNFVSLNIIGQEIKDLGLNKRINAHKVKKTLTFDNKGLAMTKRDSKENEMIIEDQGNLAPPKAVTVLGPVNRNLVKETLPDLSKPPLTWNNGKPKLPEIKEHPPLVRAQSVVMHDNTLPPLANNNNVVCNKSFIVEEKENGKMIDDSERRPERKYSMDPKVNKDMMVCDYVDDIIKTLRDKDEIIGTGNSLENHKISPSLRAKMVDWMVEVLCSYKCQEQTFFMAINVMDAFFRKTTVPHSSNDLHLVGVASMFIASKFEEIYPIRLSVLYEKVGHKKLTIDDIINKEAEIMQALGFNVITATIHEFITNVLFQLGLKNVMNPELYAYLQRVCVYLSKANMYDYELISQYRTHELAACTLFVAFKVTEQVDSSFPLTNMVQEVSQILGVRDDVLYNCATRILALAKNFDKLFPNFKNLKKFHSMSAPELSSANSERSSTTNEILTIA